MRWCWPQAISGGVCFRIDRPGGSRIASRLFGCCSEMRQPRLKSIATSSVIIRMRPKPPECVRPWRIWVDSPLNYRRMKKPVSTRAPMIRVHATRAWRLADPLMRNSTIWPQVSPGNPCSARNPLGLRSSNWPHTSVRSVSASLPATRKRTSPSPDCRGSRRCSTRWSVPDFDDPADLLIWNALCQENRRLSSLQP